MQTLVATAVDTYGQLDVAIANAGIGAGMAGNFEATAELRSEVLRVNLIGPCMTRPTFDYAQAKGVTHEPGRLNPLRRAAQPEELTQVALFLASDQSSYVNGQAIAVDGGLSTSHPVTRQATGQTAVQVQRARAARSPPRD